MKNLKFRLALMNFIEFAVWGAYLTCMGLYLNRIGMASEIGYFFAMQGIVSIFMPAIMGIVADKWIPAQRLLGYCHLLAGMFMFAAAYYGHTAGENSIDGFDAYRDGEDLVLEFSGSSWYIQADALTFR